MPEQIINRIINGPGHEMIRKPLFVYRNTRIDKVLEKMNQTPRPSRVYVVNNQGALIGAVELCSVIEYLFPYAAFGQNGGIKDSASILGFVAVVAEDIMVPLPLSVLENEPLSEVAEKMIQSGIYDLPVINSEKKLIGELSFIGIVGFYLKQKSF